MITVLTLQGPQQIKPIAVYKEFAVHHVLVLSGINGDLFNITHVPSGFAIYYRKTERGAYLWRNAAQCIGLMHLFADMLVPGDLSLGDDGQWRATPDAFQKWISLVTQSDHDVKFCPHVGRNPAHFALSES